MCAASVEPRLIRVAHIVGKMRNGGVESFLMNYYRHIDRTRVQFDFVIDADSSNRELVPEIKSLGGRVFEGPPYQQVFSYTSALKQLFATERWPIVHSHINTLSGFALRAAQEMGVPVRIAHSHSTAGHGEYLRNATKQVLKPFPKRYATHLAACSHYSGKWLFGKHANYELIYNAVDINRFIFDASVRSNERAKLGANEKTCVVGHVGRFMTQKNHGFLVEIFCAIKNKCPDSLLILVGDGELQSKVQSKIESLGLTDSVRFVGFRSDVEALYQAFDVFVLPSLYEGLPVVGIEAQMSGLPLVCSDIITREVDVSGNVRFVALRQNASVWADIVLQEACRLANQQLSFEAYDIHKAAPKLQQYYECLACEVPGMSYEA